jgi:hypothetical protein
MPLPVSPIGLGYLSQYGLYVAAVEITLFAPLLLYALGRRGPHQRVRTARWQSGSASRYG